MQLDWFTLLAEIANFLILVYLLKRFLYDRILAVADEREEKIASRFAEVEEKEAQAAAEAEKYRQQQEEIEQKRDQLLAGARQEAEERRKELLESARREVVEKQEQWYEAMARERRTFLQALHQKAGEQVYAVARRALADLADAGLEKQVTEVFVERMRVLEGEELEGLSKSLHEMQREDIDVQSAFALPEKTRQTIRRTLHDKFQEDLAVRFSQNEALICGIALRVDGHKITWSIQGYLDSLQETVAQALEEELRHKLDHLPEEEQNHG